MLYLSHYETRTTARNAIGRLVIEIKHNDYTNKTNDDHYCGYDLVIRNGTIHDNDEGNLDIFEKVFYSSTIYTQINSINTGAQIIKDEMWKEIKDNYNEIIRGYNEFRQNEEFDILDVVENSAIDFTFGEIFSLAGEALGGTIGEKVGGAVWSFSSSFISEQERVNEAKNINETISDLQNKYREQWNSIVMCCANQKRAELMLRGIKAERIEIVYNSDKIIDDVIFSDYSNEEFNFKTKYEDFYQECSMKNSSDVRDG